MAAMPLTPFRRLLLLASLGFAAALPLSAQAYSDLFVFGDSLSDTGNNAVLLGTDPGQVITDNSYIPTYPYASGRYSNGEVWTVSFAAALGLDASASLTGGNIYAHGGARTRFPSPDGTPSLRYQVRSFLGDHGGVADNGALYVIGLGGNNARDALDAIAGGAPLRETVAQAALRYSRDVGDMVDKLQAAGAERFVVWNTPDIAIAPAVAAEGAAATFLAGVVTKAMNQALALRLSGETGVTNFDTFSLFDRIAASPGDYGLSNVTDACGALTTVFCDPSSFLFWDGIHPTSAGHRILSEAMVAAVVPEPGAVWMILAGLCGLALLMWRRR
jgi:outer membrane lipase/esterase